MDNKDLFRREENGYNTADVEKYINTLKSEYRRVFEYAKSMNIPCYKGYTLDEAMRFLKQNIKSGEVVLLSPGASSQDQYLHFEDRGIEFKNIVEKY